MRTASGYQPPAVPYHTPIRGSLSTPCTIPFQGNAQYITNRELLRGKGVDVDKVEFVERKEAQSDHASSSNVNGQLK